MATSNVELRVDARQAVSALEQVNRASGTAQSAINGLKGAVAGLVGAFSAVQALKFVVAKTSELETQTRSIETLTGSVEKAKQIISELQQLGAATPFTSTELIDAAKRLNAFGVGADKVVETTRRLGDVAGATGANLGELTLAYGQVIAKGRLQGEELLQFQERGIALQDELRKMYGLSGEEFQKALSKGRISAEAVEVAIVRLTEKGGKYANGAIAQSTTLAGKFSTLTDGIESIARKIGEVLKPALKEILDLANATVDMINKALAGPDYKKANDRLYNTRARIKELTTQIQAAERAGVDMQKGLEIKGVDGQVLGGGVPVLPGMRYEMQQLQKEAKYLEDRLKSLRQKQKPGKPDTTPPPLLEEKGNKSMENLIGGQIQLTLEENKAKLETERLSKLNAAALALNADQAKRMVDATFQYRELQLEITALQQTLAARAKAMPALIASSKDQEAARVKFLQQDDQIRSQINVKQEQLNQIAAKHQTQIISGTEQERKLLEQQTKAGQDRQQSITDELALLQAKINGNEAEVILQQQLRDITKDTAGLDAKAVEDQLRKIQTLKDQVRIQEQIKAVYTDIGMSIKSGITDAIQGAIDGTKTLGDVANQVLRTIGNKLLDVAVNMALFGEMSGTGKGGGLLGSLFKPRANGGSVMAGQSYLVGERGPELFTPGRSGGIAPSGSFGAVNVIVNVDASGGNVQGGGALGAAMGRVVTAAVQAELIKQKRAGGILS